MGKRIRWRWMLCRIGIHAWMKPQIMKIPEGAATPRPWQWGWIEQRCGRCGIERCGINRFL